MRYAWIRQHQDQYPVTVQCSVLEVSSSGYYDWRDRKPSAQQQTRQTLEQAVQRSHADSHAVYGYRKVHADLREQNLDCCAESTRRMMKKLGLSAQIRKAFVVTTDSNHAHPVAHNLLERDFTATAPNQKWLADITYIATREGWLYLAAVLDLYARRIVGWAMSEHIDEDLVTEALHMAIRQRCPGQGLLHHSDRGSQYAAQGYQKVLDQFGIVCSMSRRGDCWDNAAMERFFGSLKTEWVNGRVYPTRETAKQDLFKYIEWFYNGQRRHEALGYVSPVEFEARYFQEHQHA
jgi:transposase InsO family protein